MGLRDLEKLSLIAGAKLWWRWLTYSQEPWDKLWLDKSAPDSYMRELIRFSEEKSGSHIWKITWEGCSLVQQHCFWEILNGKTGWIWEDTWQ